MLSWFSIVFRWVQWAFGVVPKSARGSKTMFRVLHYAAVAVITIVLGYFSNRIVDPASLGLDSEFVRRFWVGILFILSYLFIRLLIYLISLLMVQDEPEFRDIDRCWQLGVSELQRAGMDITYLPVFLVNGLSADDEASFFQSSGMQWKVVSPSLDDRAAVLRFFATDDALFISLSGVGAVTAQRAQRPTYSSGQPASAAAPVVRSGTLRREDIVAAQEALAAPRASAGGTLPAAALPRPSAAVGQRTMLPPGLQSGSAGAAPQVAKAQPQFARLSPEEHDRYERRMAYFAYLLKRDRAPYCPINGMLQAIPLSWSEQMREVSELTRVVADDLKVLRGELQMQAPLVVVYTELEKLPGFEEFLARCSKLDSRFRDSRAGSRFPAGKGVDNETSHWVIDRCLQWFQGWTYSGLAQDVDNPQNSRLYRLLCELNDRRRRLEQQLKELKVSGTAQDPGAWRLSGCYFVANGTGSARQAFVNGVLLKSVGEQNDVSWSDQLLRADRRNKAVGWVLLTAGVLLAAGDATFAWWLSKQG